MGVMADRTSVERILYAVFMHLNKNQGSPFSHDTKLLTLPVVSVSSFFSSHSNGRRFRMLIVPSLANFHPMDAS
jgi:hypothetical protein